MRGLAVVEEEGAFQAWLNAQPTFAQTLGEAKGTGNDLIEQGRQLAQARGCLSCHSVDGGSSPGPTWKGLYGKSETLADGRAVMVDESYLKESIANPGAAVVKDYAPIMPPYNFTGEELEALVTYIRDLSK
jgi:cytochrome c oxidase subunit 2